MSYGKRLALLAALVVCGGIPAVAQDAAVASPERIARLVKELGADELEIRDAAQKELESVGNPAVSALRQAARSEDPEVSSRARAILDRVEGGGEAKAGPGGARLHSYNFRFSPGAGNSSVVITQDGSGRLSVAVTEEVDGKRETKTYEAESSESFQQKFPEVAKRYGIGEQPGAAPRAFREFVPRGRFWADWGLGEEFSGGNWPRGLGEDMDRLQDDMRRQLDDLFREHRMDGWRDKFLQRFRDRFGKAGPKGPRDGEEERAEAPPGGPDANGDRPAPAPAALGVALVEPDPALREQLRLGGQEGVLVEEVLPGSRAERGGLRKHDVILHVNGTPVKGVWEMRRVLRDSAASDPDGVLELGVIRGGNKQTVQVRMAE